MSLKLNFSALSMSASVDQQTGSLSVFEIVEEIRTPQVPIHLPGLVIAMALEKTTPETRGGKLFIHILTPDGKQALVGQGEMNVPPEQKRLKAVFRFGGFPIQQFGQHRFVVSWMGGEGNKEGEAIFDFEVIKVAQNAQGPNNPDRGQVAH